MFILIEKLITFLKKKVQRYFSLILNVFIILIFLSEFIVLFAYNKIRLIRIKAKSSVSKINVIKNAWNRRCLCSKTSKEFSFIFTCWLTHWYAIYFIQYNTDCFRFPVTHLASFAVILILLPNPWSIFGHPAMQQVPWRNA